MCNYIEERTQIWNRGTYMEYWFISLVTTAICRKLTKLRGKMLRRRIKAIL